MTRVPLKVPPGLNTDDTPFSVKDGFQVLTARAGYVDTDKVRFWRDRPQTIGGWENLIGSALTGVCRSLLPWNDNAGTLNIGFGTNSNLQVYVGGGLYDITPVGFVAGAVDGTGGAGWGTGAYSTGTYSSPSSSAYYPMTWSLANYGQTLMANPRGGTIYWWQNVTGTPAAALTNAPAEVNYVLVNPQRQVVALGANEQVSGNYNPLCVRWSDIEGPTTWTASASNNAGEQHIEGGGYIVAGAVIGDYLFVWTDTALWQAQFIGDPGQTYRFTKLGEDCGLIGPNAFAIVGQAAFWMSRDGNFRTCVLNGEPAIIPNGVQVDVDNNIAFSQQDKIVVAPIPKFGEVWCFYPDSRDGTENSRYVAFSVLNPAVWFRGTFVRTAFSAGSPAQYPLGVDASGNVYLHEKGTSADGGAYAWFWETAPQYLGESEQRIQVKGVWPDFEGQEGAVSLTLYGRDYPQATDRTKGPFTLTPSQSKRDLLMDTRMVRVRVAGNASPTFCRGGTLELDIEPAGLQ